ncbi:MAG: S8 family serine peptidase [Mycobacteriales bacterium]
MFRRGMRLAAPAAALGLALAAGTTAGGGAASASPAGSDAAPAVARACGTAVPGAYRCLALFRPDSAYRQRVAARAAAPAARQAVPEPSGYGPQDLQSAYRLPTGRGAGQTIAIVDAFDDPNAEADLAAYRAQYGLPPCTTANGCFRKVNERGDATPLPDPDMGWGVEISLDLQMVSAACPKCHILLVEGDQPTFDDLGIAVDTAVRLGANAVSNSYGADESAAMADYLHYYDHPGHVITVSSGDFGFGVASFPAVASTVVAVGGTSLSHASNRRGWTEQAWSGAGSGCSAYVAKPRWQHDANCQLRTIADVSAVADPDTGLAVYDTYLPAGEAGWLVVGGTSASSPFVAGVVGLAGNAKRFTPEYPYRHRGSFFDVVGGSNGFCGDDYLCTGLPGYDAPTGVGTPNGISGL